MNVTMYDRYRVALIGTCQVVGMGLSLEAMFPGSIVDKFHIGVNPLSPDEIAGRIKHYDLVITQLDGRPENGRLAIDKLERAAKHVEYVPVVTFTGFQPDCVYILADDHSQITHRTMLMNSAIVAAAFQLQLPESRVGGLFNAYIYAKLGYFDAFTEAKRVVIDTFAEAGFDIAPYWGSWLSAGPFMHTVNHPAICVLATIAKLVAVRVGLPTNDVPAVDIYDHLADSAIWPCYPEIASRLGVSGSLEFQRAKFSAGPGEDPVLTLSTFIHESYESYRVQQHSTWHSQRVDLVRNVLEAEIR